jgi:drug/metabolite transporter (DMT)-like permease
VGSGVGLALVIAAQRIQRGGATAEHGLSLSDLPMLGLVILTGGVVAPLLLFLGLARMDAAPAALLLNVEGLATMLIAWIVFRENVDRRIALGAASLLAGAVVLSWDGGPGGVVPGAGLVVLACVAWGVDNNLTRKLSGSDPMQIALAKGLAAGAVNLGIGLLRRVALPGPTYVGGIALVGFLGYGVSLAFFVLALRYLATARTAAYFSTSPFVGAVLAIGLLGEPLSPQLLVAALLMGVELWLHLTEAHDHEHVHKAFAHSHRHVHDIHHQHEHLPTDPSGEPHTHAHRHERLVHRHTHYPDLHHRHKHSA